MYINKDFSINQRLTGIKKDGISSEFLGFSRKLSENIMKIYVYNDILSSQMTLENMRHPPTRVSVQILPSSHHYFSVAVY